MRTTTKTLAALLALGPLVGCGSPPAAFEGTALSPPFEVRSALFGPLPWNGGNNPPAGGARLVFTDAADYCKHMQRVREALARGEPAPQAPVDQTATLALYLNGTQLAPEQVTAGTYRVIPQDGSAEDAAALTHWAFAIFGRKGTSGGYAPAGTVQVTSAKQQAGAQTTGELSLELVGEVQGTLAGTFTASYCEYL